MMNDNKVENMLGEYLRREREETRVSLENRKRDHDYFDGMTPSSDYMSREFGYNEHENVKVNTIRRNVDWAMGYIRRMKLHSRVVPLSNNDKARKYAEYRNWQLQSQWEACRAQREVDKALKDCLVTGEGFLRVKVKTVLPGKVRAVVEHKSWKNIYYDRMNMRLDRARYLFHMTFQSPKKLIEKYPQHEVKIREFKTFILNDRGIDQSEAHEFRTSDISPEEEHIAFGEAWWREHEEGVPEGRVIYAPIIANEALDRIYLLEEPRSPYPFNKFPFVSIIADRYGRDGVPYSPLVRHSIGMEKVKQYTLRSVIEAASRSGAIIDQRAFPTDSEVSQEEFVKSLREQLSRPRGLAIVNNMDGIDLRQNHNEMQAMVQLLTLLYESSQVNGSPIDPSLLGSNTNITAAVAMQEKGRHADLSLTQPIQSYQAGIEDIGEMVLVLISKNEVKMEFPAFLNDDGEVNAMDMSEIEQYGEENNRAIEGFRFAYRVIANDSSTGYEQELLRMFTEMAKVAPEMGLGLLVATDKVVPLGKGVLEAVAGMAQKAGHILPTNILPEKMRKAGEEKEMQAQQQQQQQAEMEKQGFMAELEKIGAEAEALEAKAALDEAKRQKTIVETKILPLEALAETENQQGGSPLDHLS